MEWLIFYQGHAFGIFFLIAQVFFHELVFFLLNLIDFHSVKAEIKTMLFCSSYGPLDKLGKRNTVPPGTLAFRYESICYW